ncbi:Protein-lysine N-methyltransferase efm6 [Oleoguttula sp. CCFEE 5521]
MSIATPSTEEDDKDTSVFELDLELAPLPTYKAASTTSVDFDGLLDPPLLLHEDLAQGCGGQLWPAGMMLASYLLRERGDGIKAAESIVELGAGGGLVGLALALGVAPKAPMHLTDQLPMLALMQRNISLNPSLTTPVIPSIYDWGSPVSSSLPSHPDILLAADCVYFEPAFPLLLQTLRDLIGPKTTCYFCFKKRRRADLGFVKEMKKAFSVEDVLEQGEVGQRWRRESVFLYIIRQKGTKIER